MRKLSCTEFGCKLSKKHTKMNSGIGQEEESYTIPLRNDQTISATTSPKRKRRRAPSKVKNPTAKKRRKVAKSVSR
jgi:hypothetical protein